jgi:hypothetical protein
MKRRDFVGKVGLGSVVLASAGGVAAAAARQEGHGDHRPLDGPLASATVSFGAWPAVGDAPLNRMTTPTAPMAPNIHALLPQTAMIKAGGSVNFIIAGFHQIAVYAPGTRPGDIDTTNTLPIPMAPPAVGLIDDPENRLYLGLDPRAQTTQDRVEVVHFARPGRYLVICTVTVHLADGMYGWVRVLPR